MWVGTKEQAGIPLLLVLVIHLCGLVFQMVDGCGFMVLGFYCFFAFWSLICNYYDPDVAFTNHHVDIGPLDIFLQLLLLFML